MQTNEQSAAAKALEVVGDYAQAQDVGAIDAAMAGVQEKLKTTQKIIFRIDVSFGGIFRGKENCLKWR